MFIQTTTLSSFFSHLYFVDQLCVLNRNLDYDYLARHVYTFSVIATDGGSPPLSGSSTIQVSLLDSALSPPLSGSSIIQVSLLYSTLSPPLSGSSTIQVSLLDSVHEYSCVRGLIRVIFQIHVT